MNRSAPDYPRIDVESLLRFERDIVPQPTSVQTRALERARASLPRSHWARVVGDSPRPRSARVGRAAALVACLSGLSAAAYYAGYLRGERESVTSAVPPASVAMPVSGLPRLPEVPSASGSAPEVDSPRPFPVPPRPPGRAKPQTTSAQGSEAYQKELQALLPAQRAVAARDFGSALAAIGEHHRRFPRGKLAEEREALRIRALVGLGRRAEAQRAGAAFQKRFPRSALLERHDQMLEAER